MVSASAELRQNVARVMSDHWREPGYTCPNPGQYPWMWLWDSCFHSLIWLELGEPQRAVSELVTVFDGQDESGFTPHMGYFGDPDTAAAFWGRSGFSSITQPPMFGHAIAQLLRCGVTVPEALIDSATAGLLYFDRRRRSAEGLVFMVHPWETGADDSPRWDGLLGDRYSLDRWRELKGSLLATIERGPHGEPVHNPDCEVAPAALNALIAFNTAELASVTGDPRLVALASELTDAVAGVWDDDLGTWADGGSLALSTGRVRTAEALFCLLVDPARHSRIVDELADPTAFGGRFGPAGVHRAEPAYDPERYWRGPAWPQISYLLWLALTRTGDADAATRIAEQTRHAAAGSGLSEYWHPDTGAGGGARPQSWTGLSIIMG